MFSRSDRIVNDSPPRYVFRKPILIWLMGVFDTFLNAFFKAAPARDIPESSHITVLRLDHIGDILYTLPLVQRIQESKPDCSITFITTLEGEELLRSAKITWRVIGMKCRWYSANRSAFLISFADCARLIHKIRNLRPDVIIDPRGDVRSILCGKIARPSALIAGYGVTGGAGLLNIKAEYPHDAHFSEHLNAWVRVLGIQGKFSSNPLSGIQVGREPLDGKVHSLIASNKRFRVLVHLGAGTPAKRWPVHHWVDLIKRLGRMNTKTILIGKDDYTDEVIDRLRRENILTEIPKEIVDVHQETSLSQLGSLMRECDLLVSSDSGPAHLAGAVGLRTVILFSGTNVVSEWNPMDNGGELVTHQVPCSPCHERSCPLKVHECMEGIKPQQVAEKIKKLLEKISRDSSERSCG